MSKNGSLLLVLSHSSSALLQKYLSIQGERRSGVPAYTHKCHVNALSTKQVHFQDEDESHEEEENENRDEEPFLAEQLRATYVSKGRTTRVTPTRPKTNFPLTPKQQHDLLNEVVKDVLRQQYAFYWEQIRSLQEGSSKYS